MNKIQLSRMYTGKGFIAALDQSGGSTPKALALYGVQEDAYKDEAEMFDMVHEMRTRIIKSKEFNEHNILGAILFEQTMDRQIDGRDTADYLWEVKKVIPFLKVDQGLLPAENGVQLMKEIDGLDSLLTRAVDKHIFGTKMRSVIKEANPQGIKDLVDQQFKLAIQIYNAGLIPIIEPEVDIHAPEKEACEELLKKELVLQLDKLPDSVKVIFKVTLPNTNNFYEDLTTYAHVVRIVALSGGYSRQDANKKLTYNKGLIASFSRALSEGLSVTQNDQAFNTTLKKSIKEIYKASTSKL